MSATYLDISEIRKIHVHDTFRKPNSDNIRLVYEWIEEFSLKFPSILPIYSKLLIISDGYL
jgi:hypothetical protein